MSDFNLRHLVREVLDASSRNDPHELAVEVLDRIEDGDLRAALGQCLPDVVREVNRSSRNGSPFAHRPADANARPSHVRAVPETPAVMSELPGGSSAAAVRPKARSAKVVAYREMGQRWLHDRLQTGSEPREWKQLGDCGFSDLMFAARDRREQAARTLARAKWYEDLAALVQTHSVSRVRDLPADVLSGLGGAAA